MSWRVVVLIAGAGWLLFLVWLAERGDMRARRRTRARQATLARWQKQFMDEQRLADDIASHPAGHTPRKRYYR